MFVEFERLEDCPATGEPVVLAGCTIAGAAFGSVTAFRWCSHAGGCATEEGSAREIPACRLNHVEHAVPAAGRSPGKPSGEGPARVVVPHAIADLVPTFLENRRREARALVAALQEGDLAQVDRVAQRMVGGGAMFGFDAITAHGKEIRGALARKSRPQVEAAVAACSEYLQRVLVVYEAAPASDALRGNADAFKRLSAVPRAPRAAGATSAARPLRAVIRAAN